MPTVASLTEDTHARREATHMPRFIVTGGPTGDAGIDIGSDRFEPGDEIDATTKSVKWLVDDGYLEPVGKSTAPDPEPVEEED